MNLHSNTVYRRLGIAQNLIQNRSLVAGVTVQFFPVIFSSLWS